MSLWLIQGYRSNIIGISQARTNQAAPAVAASITVTNTQPAMVLTLFILFRTKPSLPCCVIVFSKESLCLALAKKSSKGAGMSTYLLYSLDQTTHYSQMDAIWSARVNC